MRFLMLECKSGKYECELNYASCVARGIAKAIRGEGHDVKEVESPSPADANNAIENYNPDHVWWIGHGNACLTTLEKMDLWISSGECGCSEKNMDVLSGVTANALSCITAKCLGKELTKNGADWYLGYYESFVFIACGCEPSCACGKTNPSDKVRDEVGRKAVVCMHQSNLYFTLGLAKGYTQPQAHGFSLNRFKHWIKFWEEFEPQNDEEEGLANMATRVLRTDKKRQRLVKNGKYIEAQPPPAPAKKGFPLHAVAGALGMAVVPVGIAKAE